MAELDTIKPAADAQFNLGLMYDQGIGVPQDYETHMWFNIAGSKGKNDSTTN
jgi:TPR repeat protein